MLNTITGIHSVLTSPKECKYFVNFENFALCDFRHLWYTSIDNYGDTCVPVNKVKIYLI